MSIRTYHEMNEAIKDLLGQSDEQSDKYILTRILELESKVKQLSREILTLNSVNKRYKEALDIMVVHADDPDVVKDIYNELVIKMDKLEESE
mgnify:FL=1